MLEENIATGVLDDKELPILIPVSRESLGGFCGRHGIQKLSVFGSYARGEQKPGSDVDMLVEFDPKRIPDLLAMVSMELELTELVGRRVDLRTLQEVSRYARRRVLSEAKPLVV